MARIALALSSFCTATEACTQESSENVSRCDGGKGNKHDVCSPSGDKRTRVLVVDEELEPSSSFGGLGRDTARALTTLALVIAQHRWQYDDLDLGGEHRSSFEDLGVEQRYSLEEP